MNNDMKLKVIEAITKEALKNDINIKILCEHILNVIKEK